ncbi:MAG: MBL fold metallo-hydrolase [Bacteroidales bacterium]|nr:MBL fold metallo-hydrolase [Bacteroidales bacterium]
MKLTYIFHSGFALEGEKTILIFDFWHDPANVVAPLLASHKPIYVLSSHFHEDHFNRDIFAWRDTHSDIRYLLSSDIKRHRRATPDEADAWLGKGATWSDGNISVWAMGSNDSGVSWIVECEGRRIFHAGDLNNWYAKFISNPDYHGGKIYSSDFEAFIDPIADEKRYLGELKDIGRCLKSMPLRDFSHDFDLVMIPIDGRIGNGYTLGGRQFIERFSVGLFVPMHFTSGIESAMRMKEYTDAKKIPFWSIGYEGDTIEF